MSLRSRRRGRRWRHGRWRPPFMRWQDRAISDTPRFQYLAEMYCHLAPVHGVRPAYPPGRALRRRGGAHGARDSCRHMFRISSPCRPASPYCEGVDTLFSCRRLNAVNSFPLAGHMPADVDRLVPLRGPPGPAARQRPGREHRDLYWDIRPKPGTARSRSGSATPADRRAGLPAGFPSRRRWRCRWRDLELPADWRLAGLS